MLEDEQSNKRYVDIESIVIHPEFSNQTHDNDIALIRLKEEQTGIKPICLPFEDAYGIWESIQQHPGDAAMLSGWTKKVRKSREVDLSGKLLCKLCCKQLQINLQLSPNIMSFSQKLLSTLSQTSIVLHYTSQSPHLRFPVR